MTRPDWDSDPSSKYEKSELVLVVAWYTSNPSRVGEVLTFPWVGQKRRANGSAIFGRSNDVSARARLVWQRPGENIRRPPIGDVTISRDQLLFRRLGDNKLDVEQIGQCPMRVNGNVMKRAVLQAGDIVALHKQMLFICMRRPPRLPALDTAVSDLHPFGEADENGIVGEGQAAWTLRDQIAVLAPRDRHTILFGETGTGKELVAQALHARSRRGARALIARSAVVFTDSLIDAEIFGNPPNWPNPGMAERNGLIGDADGSSLFFDEIGDMPQSLQAHLLRVMDAGEYQRLGETRVRKSDVRLIAATNRPPSAIKHDLLARFALQVTVPPLRERRGDVPLLIRHLLRNLAEKNPDLARSFIDDRLGEPRVHVSLVDALVRHDFSKNVRGLEKVLWKAIISNRKNDRLRLTDEVRDFLRSDTPDEPAPRVDIKKLTPQDLQACWERHERNWEPVWRELGMKNRDVLRRLRKRFAAEGWDFDNGGPAEPTE